MERKRKVLSLETKYEIINEFEKSGKSKIEIAKHYDIPKSTLSGILNIKEKHHRGVPLINVIPTTETESRHRRASWTFLSPHNHIYVKSL